MHFFYSENQPFTSSRPFRASDYNANAQIEKHLENWFYLRFIQTHTDDITERHQSTQELTICDRKIEFWKRQDNYCFEEFTKSVKKFQELYEYRVTYAKAHKIKNFKSAQVKFVDKNGRRIR
jgi:hypothetical protein